MYTDLERLPDDALVSTQRAAASAREASRASGIFPTAPPPGEIDAERRQLERLSQVGRACAMVAHEIANPLAAIKATIQSIERDAAAAGLADPVSAVYDEIDRLDRIVRQLLGFVRHRAPHKVETDLRAVVESARRAAGARLRGITFSASYGVIPPVRCDPDEIEQVLLNVFLNAAEAMPRGGELAVRAAVEGDLLVIRIEDEGSGVPQELRESVFESFFTTKPTGTGLGLTVCRRIVTDHGGSISIEGRGSGRGASVRVTLPSAGGE
jgi:signal transduction histidine kinase